MNHYFFIRKRCESLRLYELVMNNYFLDKNHMNHYLSLTKKKLQNDNVTFSYEKVMKHKIKKLQMIVNSFLESCAGDTRNESWTD